MSAFPLSAIPLPESIQVTVDGLPVSGFSWIEQGNRIVFDSASAPAGGSEIRIEYLQAPECEG